MLHNFAYSAVDRSGKSIRGHIRAANDIDLELRLKRIELDLITFRLVRRRIALFGRTGASPRELSLFCFGMGQLLRAGLPMLQALAELRNSAAKPVLREVLSQLGSSVEAGQTLSSAMAEHPHVFQPVFVSLIQTGEQTGRLSEIFDQLSSTLAWQDDMLAQTRRALAYPGFVLAVVVASAVFLLTYLVPQMAVFLKSMGQDLPLQTRFMVALSTGLVRWWWAILFLAVFVILSTACCIALIPAARHRFDTLKLELPLMGNILKKAAMARFARYFALMYQAGIPILDALEASHGIVGNRAIANRLEQAYERISAGERMSECFGTLALFPPLVIRMMRIGENTGGLDDALLKVSEFYDRDVKNSIESMLKLLEPTLTVLLGALLALIMFSVLGPVYDAMTGIRL